MSGGLWLKLKHGAPANPKWRMIAQKVGCAQGEVWTLYSWALDYAGQHQGSLKGFDLEEVAGTTDYLLDELQRVWAAFVDREIIVGDQIHNWVEHQGVAAVAAQAKSSTARVQKHRALKRQEKYQEYLQSEAWQALRQKVAERCNEVCEDCGKRPMAQVHHLTYDRIFKERLEDLVGLCAPCHEKAHGIVGHA